MTTLWKKEWVDADEEILSFTVGDDRVLDNRLIPYDIIGSLAHADGLARIGILTDREFSQLGIALKRAYRDWACGAFRLSPKDEDVHSALEHRLTEELGEVGKKIHAGRSRNDQVLTALRLFMKKALLDTMEKLAALTRNSCDFGARHRNLPMPGYTHMQRAMPSTVAFWYASFSDSFADALEAGQALYRKLDSSPLGAAAGFGVPLPLEREHTAKRMGFGRVHVNAMAVQNSRGRLEAAFAGWLAEIGRDVEKVAWDLLLFSSAEFDFVRIPEALCTGSSIMPQKKNPDVLELLRATPSVFLACRDEIERIISKLPSSYHRDFQLTKGPMMRAVDQGRSVLTILGKALKELTWNEERLKESLSTEMLATHRALVLVREGIPFRDAYVQAAKELRESKTDDWPTDFNEIIAGLNHLGAPGNPGLDEARIRADTVAVWVNETRKDLEDCWDDLLD
ncbi:MAG: argininosuccinate lyase [Deltaproteobacteria bacterium]|nr:argininosuccinate lyase [Deltaproteobacteria bacterium]